jgi:hypothetical protein
VGWEIRRVSVEEKGQGLRGRVSGGEKREGLRVGNKVWLGG